MSDERISHTDKHAVKYLSDASLYPELSLTPDWPLCKFTEVEIEFLHTVGLLSNSLTQSPRGHFSTLFAVDEQIKHRRRIVQDSLSANVLCDEPGEIDFTPIPRLRRCVFKGQYGCTFDVRAMYYHFGLSKEVAEKAFRVLTQDGYKTFNRLPMGFKWAAKIAQVAITFLTLGIQGVHIELYIDNIMFIGSLEATREARRIFLERCVHYNFTLGEDSGITSCVTHRGLQFDLIGKRVRLSTVFVEKFQTRIAVENGTWADRRALMGSMVYATTSLDIPLGKIYHLLKWLARHTLTKPSDRAPLWAQCIPQWRYVCNAIRHNQWISPPPATEEAVIISDAATETRLGAVLVLLPSGRFMQHAFEIKRYASINDMEAQALYVGLRKFASVLRERHILYWGDNTAVLSTLRSSYSRSFALNIGIGRIIKTISELRSIISPFYVPSAFNPADAPTRFATFSADHILFMRDCRRVMNATRYARQQGVECWRGSESDPLRPRVCISETCKWSSIAS